MVKNVGVEKQVPVDDMETACKFARREKAGTHGKIKQYEAQFPDDKLPYTMASYKLLYWQFYGEKLPLLHNFDERLKRFHDKHYKVFQKNQLTEWMVVPVTAYKMCKQGCIQDHISYSDKLVKFNLDESNQEYPSIRSVVDPHFYNKGNH